MSARSVSRRRSAAAGDPTGGDRSPALAGLTLAALTVVFGDSPIPPSVVDPRHALCDATTAAYCRGMSDWASVFDPSAPVLEIIARGVFTYLGLLLMLRIVGQREAGAIGLHDLLVIVLIAEAAAHALGEYKAIPDGLLLVATILASSVAVDAIAWRWPRLGRWLKPSPKPLIEDGKLNEQVLRRELMTKEEVLSQLRLRGIEDLSQVKRAYIEPNGMISVIRVDGGEVEAPEPQTVA